MGLSKKALFSSVAAFVVIVIITALLLREDVKIQQPRPIEVKPEEIAVQERQSPQIDFVVRDFSSPAEPAITVVKRPSIERQILFIEKRKVEREKNLQLKSQSMNLGQSSQGSVPDYLAADSPQEPTAGSPLGITKIADSGSGEPTTEEIQEMNAKGIIIY